LEGTPPPPPFSPPSTPVVTEEPALPPIQQQPSLPLTDYSLFTEYAVNWKQHAQPVVLP
jgi:hypothetical protein